MSPSTCSTRWPTAAELVVKTLGECRYVSPLAAPHAHEPFVDEMRRVLLCSDAVELGGMGDPPSSFEPAGPRARIFFEHEALTCGILTCGGLCPGLNNVVRAIVLRLAHAYRVRRIYGFRYGYDGLAHPEMHASPGCSSRTRSSSSTNGAARRSARRADRRTSGGWSIPWSAST